MEKAFRRLALPIALVAGLAGCSTLKPSTKPEEAPTCPASSRIVDDACLDTTWSCMDALEWRCEDRGGEMRVSTVEHAPTWVCDLGAGEVIW